MGGRLSKANCCKGDGASERTTGQEDSGHVGPDHGHFFLADAHDGHDHSHGHAHEHGDHASEVFAMGTVTLGPSTYAIDREGQCETGRACTFGVELIGAPVGSRAAMAGGPADVWLESASGERLGAPVAGEGHELHWHFTVTPEGGAGGRAAPSRLVLRARDGATRAIDLCAGAAPRHDGIRTPLRAAVGTSAAAASSAAASEEVVGFLEVRNDVAQKDGHSSHSE
jgi:hypothetical protein